MIELIKRKVQEVDKRKIGLTSAIIGIIVIIILLAYNYVRVPGYEELLNRIELSMRAQNNISIDYFVTLVTDFDRETQTYEGIASYNMTRDQVEWTNDLAQVEGTFYDKMPHDVVEVMRQCFFDAVETYHQEMPCYLLNGVGYLEESENVLMTNYSYLRAMACFDKETGYPLQYTLMIVGEDAVFVSYDSLSVKARLAITGEANVSPLDDETIQELLSIYADYGVTQ